MSYILQKGNNYCLINSKHAICKTQSSKEATVFESYEEADQQLSRATKKLAGFQIVCLAESEGVKVKRKQFSAAERTILYNKCKGRCAVCGKFMPYDSFTMDHIIPLAKGGANARNNLQCNGERCRRINRDIMPEDLMKNLTEIMLYQMRKDYDDTVYKRLRQLRRARQKKKRLGRLEKLSSLWRSRGVRKGKR